MALDCLDSVCIYITGMLRCCDLFVIPLSSMTDVFRTSIWFRFRLQPSPRHNEKVRTTYGKPLRKQHSV